MIIIISDKKSFIVTMLEKIFRHEKVTVSGEIAKRIILFEAPRYVGFNLKNPKETFEENFTGSELTLTII